MTTKERLHQLVDALSPDELAEAEKRLPTLRRAPPLYTLDNAPPDDEPDDDDRDGGLTEAREQMARGEVFTMEEVKKELGLCGPPRGLWLRFGHSNNDR
ncbi:MAG: hypothetical protein ACREKN_06905 [Longimicrobiaceae bacterium]